MRGQTRSSGRAVRAQASGVFALLLLLAGVASAEPELTRYGRLPHIEEVALSGDGSRLAFLRTEGDERIVSVYNTDDHKFLRGVKIGQKKARWIDWADADHLLITTSTTTVPIYYIGSNSEWFQTVVFDVRDGSLAVVPQGDERNGIALMNAILSRPVIRHVNGHTLLYMGALQTSTLMNNALVCVDLQARTTRVVQPAREARYNWLIDNAGQIAVDESYNSDTRHWRIVAHRDGHAQEVAAGQENMEYPHFVGWGPDADTVLIEQIEDNDPVWRLLSLKDGSLGAPMAERRHFEAPIENPVTHLMIGAVHTADSQEITFFDTITRYSWEMVLAAFPGERVRLASNSDDFRKFVVRVESPQKGYRYMLLDLDTHRLTALGEVYEGLKPYEVRRIDYPAADGTVIPAYLTLPDRKAEKLPLVVLPHGGPQARDTADFDWWSQALASLGYAVLRPNYRGSALGWHFLNKGFGEWGRKMQTDLSDGVRYLAKEGLVDPQRVCIVGASYGGYAALAGPSLDPGVYRCAVAVAGISDVRRMLEWVNDRTSVRNGYAQRYWDRFMGVKGPRDPAVDTISPIMHLDAITVPILLIHGKDDTVVDYEQSQVMYDALRGAKKDVQLVTLKQEDHWLSHSETRLQMLQATASFLLAHSPPQ